MSGKCTAMKILIVFNEITIDRFYISIECRLSEINDYHYVTKIA